MVIAVNNLKSIEMKGRSFLLTLALSTSLSVSIAGEMPTGASVQSGNVEISGKNTNHLIIEQSTNKSIISWDSFSIHDKGRVDFNMPSSISSSLNRVTGSTPSSIAGQLNSNGKVLIINPNGVMITKNGVVKTGSFTASTLDINNDDFLKDKMNFIGNGKSKGVQNNGKIIIGDKGYGALLGGQISNAGIVSAKLGKIALGAGEKITLDFVGDGLMSVSVPSEKLGFIKDINGNTLKSLISNSGLLKANGGIIKLSAATAKNLSRSSVNIGSSGLIIARSVNDKTGKVVIGSPTNEKIKIAGKIDVSGHRSLTPSGTIIVRGRSVIHKGKIFARGGTGGKVNIISKDTLKLDGSILAQGTKEKGGSVLFLSEKSISSTPKTLVDVSGANKGGRIRSLAKTNNVSSGTFKSNSEGGKGGNIDLTADRVEISNAKIEAAGNLMGGKVRIGGDYLGGQDLTIMDNKNVYGFVSRFGDQPSIQNSKQTIVKADTNIDVSSKKGQGGTAVVWSDQMTDFDGKINARGAEIVASTTITNAAKSTYKSSKEPTILTIKPKFEPIESTVDPPPKQVIQLSRNQIKSQVDPPPPKIFDKGGGFVEISSKNYLKRANIAGVSLNGGTLLLDPRDIYVRDSSLSGYTLTSNLNDVDSFNDGTNALYQVNSSTIETALTAGTNVILQARQDIIVQSDIIATGSSGGDLTLNAGVDINISADITTANGDLNLIANNASVTSRGTEHSDIDVTSTLNLGTGDLNITLGNFSSGDSNNVHLGNATINANNITLTDSGTGSNTSRVSILGDLNASSAINVTSTNKRVNVGAASLTANGTGTAVDITSKYLSGNGGSVSTPNGIWRATNTDTSSNGARFGGFTGNFIQYGYSSGDAIQGTGSGLLSAYDPGNLTRIYNVFSSTSYHLTKEYDGTNSTASASFNTSSPAVTGASGAAIPTGLTVTLNNPTFTYDNVNQGNQQVSADAAYTITSKTHSNFSNIFGLSTSATPATLTGRVTRKGIQIQGEKYYDATTDIAAAADSAGFGGLEIIGLISGEDLQFSAGTDSFFTMVADPGNTYTSFNMNNISLATGTGSGGVAGDPNNYNVTSTLFRIKPRPLKVKLTKQYDTNATFGSDDTVFFEYPTMGSPPSNAATRTGVFNETLALSGTGTISGGATDVGTGYVVTGMSLSDGFGAASNYSINGNIEADISQKVVNLSGQRASNGSTSVAGSIMTVDTGTSQTLTASGSGTAAQSAPGVGITVNATTPGINLVNGTGAASNYTLTGGTHTVDITATSAYIAGTKVYDASTVISASILSLIDPSDPGASVTISGSATASSANVGNSVSVTDANIGSLALGGADAGNYDINTIAINGLLNVAITPKKVNLSGTRLYNGTVDAAHSDLSVASGTVGTETLTISGTGTLNAGGAGSRTINNTGSLALGNGTNGGIGANYTLDGGTHSMTINALPLTITGTKIYDGDNEVHSNTPEAQIQNIVPGENVLFSGFARSDSEDVGTNINIGTINTWALSDQTHAASNYTFTGGNLTIDITQREIKLTGTKTYDGNTDAVGSSITRMQAQGTFSAPGSSSNSSPFSTGLVSGGVTYFLPVNVADGHSSRETLTINGTGTANSKDVSSANILSSNGTLALADGSNGGKASNYKITLTSDDHAYTVTQKSLGLSGSKVYDGTDVVLASELPTVTGLIGSETVVTGSQTTTSGSTATKKNVANNVTITSNASGITLADGSNGGLAANYTLTGGTHQVSITKAPVTIGLTRQYDGTTNASSNATDSNTTESYSGLVGSETLTLTGQGSVASKNVSGSTQSVTLGTIALGDQAGATTSSGGLASNYNLTSAALTINKKVLNSNSSRIYNATTAASASDITLTNQVSGESLQLSNAAATSNANVGSYSISDLSGITISDEVGANASSGALAANYTLTGGTHTFAINSKSVNVAGTRQYDGTTNIAAADISAITDTVNSEVLTMSGGLGTTSSANVAAYNLVNTSQGTLTLANGPSGANQGLASNYTLIGGTQDYTITQRVLNSSGSKTYDANTDALAGAITLSNLVSGEALNHSGTATIGSANAGSYTITNLSGISIADGSGGTASNYTLTGGTHNFTVNRRAVSVSGTRLYDATTNAVASDLSTHANLVGSETLNLSGTGTIASKNVGSNKTVSVGTLALADGSNGGLAANYTLSGGTHQLTVNQRPLNATLVRQYDGTTTAAGSTLSSFDALQGGETLTMTGSGTAASANVANGIAMSSNGTLALADGTGLASNYSLNSTVINIAQRVLNSSGSKTYDANTDALAGAITLSNLVSGEALNHSGTATIGSANAGSYTITNLSGISIADGSGGTASNYTLTGGTHNFTVNRRAVSVSGTRLYDATTNAVASDLSTHANLVGSETLNLSGTGTIASKNVGSNKTVSVGTLALADGSNGGLAANYTLSGGTHQLTVNQRPLNATLVRQYDGTTTAAGSTLSSFDALQGGETLTMTGSGTAASANVANGIAMSSNGTLALADGTGLASNYSLNSTVINIAQRVLNSSGSKTYDANTDALAGAITLSNLVSGEALNHSGTATIGSANAGSYTITNLSGISIADGSGGTASNYTLTGGTHNFTINQRPLAATIARQYDGTNTAAGSDLSSFDALQGGETLTLSGSGTVGDENVANGQGVTLGSLALVNGTGLASNYSLNSASLNITKRVLNSSGSKTYDANTDALAGAITLSNLVSGEALNHSGTATIGSANAGSYTITNLSGISIADGSGGTASNYTLTGGTHNFTVNRRAVSVSGTRLYDATTNAVASDLSTHANLVGSETLNLSGTGTIASKNVGSNKTVSVGTLALADGSNGGLAANYTLSGGTHQLTVNQRPLNATLVRQYDGTTTAAGSDLSSFDALQGGETLTMTGSGTAASANVANGIAMSSNGTLALADGTGLASNYSLNSTVINIAQRVLNSSGSKTYDANTDALAGAITLSNLVSGEALNHSGTATIGSANAGSYTITNLSGISIADGSGGTASNYTLTGGTHNFTVNRRAVSVSGTRLYDATTNAVASDLSTHANLVGSETLNLSGTGTIASKNVGSNKTVSVGTLALADGSNGGLAANYTLSGGTHQLTVNQRPLNVTIQRVYDGGLNADGSNLFSFDALQGGETLFLSGTGTVSNKNVSSNQSITLGTLALSDTGATGDTANYSLNSAKLNILQRPISTVYLTKLYDASTTVQASDLQTMTNLVGSETLTLTGTSTIPDANVGVKTVNTGGFTLNDQAGANASSGGLASNYILSGGTHQLTINQRPLAATIARQYDGTNTAAGSDLSSFDALQGGETLTLSGSGTVGDENVANGQGVTLGSLALVNGTGLASNYSLNSASLNITKRVLNSSGSKTYDANTDALAGAITLSNLVSGEALNHSGTATISSANAGSYTITNLSGISIADGSGGTASNYTLTGGTHNFTVNRRAVSVSGTRLYDATTNAVASDLSTHANLVGSETLNLSGTGTIASKNVGSNKTVSVGTLALADGSNGGLAANYTLSGGTHQLTVNQRPLNATLARQYDGTTTAAGSTLSSFDALQGGETLTMTGSGTAASANVANGIAMSSNGTLALADGTGLASNYSLNSTVINIAQRVLNSSGSKTYDANTDALAGAITLSNLVSGEALNHSGTATIGSANAGSYTITNLSGISIADGSGGTASNYTLTGGTHNFTVNTKVVSIQGNKIYDGNTTISSGDITSVSDTVGAETLVISGGSGTVSSVNTATYASANINEGTLTLGNGTNGGIASNYTLTGHAASSFQVTQRVLSSSGSRIYDGSRTASSSDLTLSNLVGSETLTLSGNGTLGNANVGTNKSVTLNTLSIADGTNGGLAANYNLIGGTHQLTVTQRVVNATGTRLYDATSNANSSDLSLGNLVGSETLVLSGTGTLADKNVAINKTIGVGTLSLANGGGGGLAANYTLSGGTHLLTINQKPVLITGTRTYNAATTTLPTNLSIGGLVGGESISLTGQGTIADKNVGAGKTITLNTLTLNDGANPTHLASNYTFTGGTHTFDVTKAPLSISATRQYDGTQTFDDSIISISGLQGGETLTVSNNIHSNSENVGSYSSGASNLLLNDLNNSNIAYYFINDKQVTGDGTWSNGTKNLEPTLGETKDDFIQRALEQMNAPGASMIGFVLRYTDATKTTIRNARAKNATVNASNTSNTVYFNLANKATWEAATGESAITHNDGFKLLDNTGLASNYSITSDSFVITQRTLNSSGNRLYDATTTANSGDLTLSNLVGSETLAFSGNGTLSDADVATNKTVSVGTLALADGSNGGLAANYTLSGGTHQLTVNQRPLNATLVRQYDGTTTAAGSTLSSFDALQGGETLTMTGSGTAASANVANGIAMSSNGTLALADGTGLASNYSLNSTVINIAQRVLNSSGSKTYDANTDALAGAITLSNLVSGEALNHSGTATIGSANAGSYTITNLSGISIADGSGGTASNYTLTGGTHNFTVNRRAVSVSGTRLYDATTNAVASDLSTHANLVGSETLNLSGTGTIASKNVGSNKTVSVGTLALADGSNGGLAANYTLSGGTHQLTVNNAPISLTGSRQYDGTQDVRNSEFSLSGLQGGEDLTTSGLGSVVSKNIGNGKTVNTSGLTLENGQTGTAGLASNYTFSGGTQTFNITERVTNMSASRDYNSLKIVSSGIVTLSNLVGNETLALSGNGSVSDENVGTNKTIGVDTLSLADGANGGIASNYTLAGGTHLLTVNKAVISITGTRQYDGSTNALTADLSLNNLQGGENLTLTGNGTISDKNVANSKTLDVSGLTLGNGSGGTPGLSSNYKLDGGTHAFNVTKKNITFSGSRVYDGTTTVSSSDLVTNDTASGETLAFSGSGTVSSANVQNNQFITLGSITITDGSGGGLASNYNLTTGTFDISQKWVSVGGQKIYDATTTVSSSDLNVTGEVAGESISITGTGSVTDKNVGSGKTIDVSGLSLSDGSHSASNYTIGTTSFAITRRNLSIGGEKVYDGTGKVLASHIDTVNTAGGETLTISGEGSVLIPSVGTNKSITLNTLGISDGTNGTIGLASNYTLDSGSFDITTKPITISGSRQYDGTTDVVSSDLTLIGQVSGESISITGTGSVTDKNVGAGKTINTTGLSLADNTSNASNYSLSTGTLTINNKILSISGTRAYDGSTTVSSGNISLNGLIGSETLNKSGSVSTSSPNASTYGSASINTTALLLSDGSNGGLILNYTLLGGSHSVLISKKSTGVNGSKVYDGNTSVSSSNLSLTGLIGSETLNLSGSGTITTSAVGDNKSVTDVNFTLSDNSGAAANYNLNGTLEINVTQRPVVVSGSKVYDGNSTVDGSSLTTFSNLVGSETLSVSGNGSVSSTNVGSGKTVTLGTLALANGTGSASNYSISSANFDITQRPLTLVGSKIYDGNTTIQGSLITTFTNIVGSETLSVSGSGTVSSANVGNAKTLSTSGLSLVDNSGQASNYSIASASSNITQRPLNLSGSRAYDSTRTASGSDLSFTNIVSGETLGLTGSGVLDSPAAGSRTIVNTNTLAISDGSGIASNYTLTNGTLTMTIVPRPTTVSGTKTYDGTTNVASSNLSSFTNLAGSDTLSLSGTGTISSADVGTGKTVNTSGLTIDNSSGVGSNYTLSAATVNVTERVIGLSGVRAFDGTNNASSADLSISNLVSGENLTLSGSGTVPNATVEMNKAINLGSLTISDGSGGKSSNYTLTGGSLTLDISQLSVNVTGSRQYDGTKTVNSSDLNLTNLVSGETVSLTGAGTVADENVGANKTVTTGSLALTGPGAGNYTLSNFTTTFEITPRILNSSGARIYDGSITANASDLSLSNLVGSETLNLSGSGTLLSAAAGNSKTVTKNTLSLSDNSGSASNYTLDGGTHLMNITQRPITLVASREYDGSNILDGTSVSTTFTYSNLVGSEILSQTGTGTVSNKNVGSGKAVTVSNLSLLDGSGAASNYNLTSSTLTITTRPLNLSGSRVYDSTTSVAASDLSTMTNLVGSETIILSGNGVIGNKNVADSIALTNVSGLSLGDGSNGGLASNYTLSGGTHTVNVTKRLITISGSKTYDGSTTVQNSSISTISNRASGETLNLNGSGTVDSAAVGTNKAISLGSLALADNSGLASNYELSSGSFDVNIRDVTFVGTRHYDGTTDANTSNFSSTFSNLVSGENLNLTGSGSVSSKNVASGQSLSLGSIALANGTAASSNYNLTSATLDITKRPLDLTGTRIYDSSATAASSDLTTINNLVGSETIGLSGNGVLGNANVGDLKTLTNVSGLTISDGTNGGLAANYTLSGGTQTMSVTKRPITISGSRFYDGTTTVNGSDISTFNNTSAGETFGITGSGSVSTAISGTGKTIILGTLQLRDGTGLASNYSLSSGTFVINSRQLNITGSRVYDNTTTVNGSDLAITTGVGSEIITLSGQGSVTDANVGSNKSVTQNTLSLVSTNGSATNYTMGTISLSITKRPVDLSIEKIYDGTLDAPASGLQSNGISNTLGGQTLTLSGNGQMQNKNVGVGKNITSIGTLALGNGSGSASNYTLDGGNHSIDVTARATSASGSRFYDGTNIVNGNIFDSFTNIVGSDTITISGSGTIGSPGVGSKSVNIGSLTSAHPNYSITGASMNVTKRPVNLFGSRVAVDNPSLIVLAEELTITTANNESLTLTGQGSIQSNSPGSVQNISLGSLSFSDGTGSTSNYTFSGGSFLLTLKHKLTFAQRIREILKKGRSGKNLILLPTKTSHRIVPAVAEKISISTPDQSITVAPCVLRNGLCN